MMVEYKDIVYNGILELLCTRRKKEALEAIINLMIKDFSFYSTIFIPISSDNKQLSYQQSDKKGGVALELLFALNDFTHPFSHVIHEKKTKEIELQALPFWRNQSKQFDRFIHTYNLNNGLIVIPLLHDNNMPYGCFIVSLVEYRNVNINNQLFEFFIKTAALHFHNIEIFRSKEDEEIYLNHSVMKHQQAYLNYLKKIELKKTIIADSLQMETVLEKMIQIADTEVSLLFSGNAGTGKSYLAKVFSQQLKNSNEPKPLIEINCQKLKKNWEAVFFGADGVLSQSNNGVLLLEDITFLPIELQSVLSSIFLNKRYVDPITEKSCIYAGRVISTTRENYADLLKKKHLRPDFYAQISQVIFHLPDLEERKEDLQHFLDQFISNLNADSKASKRIIGYTDGFLKKIINKSWKNNLHDLFKYLTTKVQASTDGVLKVLQKAYGESPAAYKKILIVNFVSKLSQIPNLGLPEILEDLEFAVLEKNLEKYEGNRQLIAEKLNLPLRTLSYKCQKHGLYFNRRRRK